MKKILKGFGIVFGFGLLLIILMFYWLSKPKGKDVSQVKPFVDIINTKVTTKRPTLILLYPGQPIDKNYIYHLEDGNSFGMNSDLETIFKMPNGTEVIIDKVKLQTGRVSGTTSCYLLGKVTDKKTKQTYAFQYSWGNYYFLGEDKPYWKFEQAFWQDKPLTDKYYIKIP
ncbi:hypothetical protein [Aquimarina algicola]|uniref:Uncharacterized protein n=1 Tax=Aquimarina algicola TaxID=2589995 RepID=A0A504J6S2_9FLAO|nr:hypothetical protein [Aquimarina algicola]TPN82799.1 hypothetical protein FHK87_20445 [Aquimarina algicola]